MAYRRRYANQDPHWITARYASQCTTCGGQIKPGDRIFYYPANAAVMCAAENCGQHAARDFSSAAQDEAFMQSQFPGGGY